jgi:hypothetical protein
VTRLAPLWQQNGSYPAQTDRVLLGTLWPTSGSTGGAVTTQAATMNVNVAAGTAAVALTTGQYSALCRWDATEVVTLTAAPPAGQSRIDRIVCQVRDAVLDAGSNNDFLITAVVGTPATTGSQVPPATPTNAYALADVTVPGGVANLNSATITDRRVPLNPRDTLHAMVYRAAAWTTTTGWTAVPFDTVDRDPAGLWVPANNAFTVPVAGVWQAAGHWGTNAAAANHAAFVSVAKNGTQTRDGSFVIAAAAANALGTMVSGALYAVAGDKLSLLHLSSTATAGFTGIGGCWFSVDYLGTG